MAAISQAQQQHAQPHANMRLLVALKVGERVTSEMVEARTFR